MKYYQEFSLDGSHGLYRFRYNPKLYTETQKIYAETWIKYYFVIKTETQIFGTPVNEEGELIPVNKLLIDPVQYYKQQARLNK